MKSKKITRGDTVPGISILYQVYTVSRYKGPHTNAIARLNSKPHASGDEPHRPLLPDDEATHATVSRVAAPDVRRA